MDVLRAFIVDDEETEIAILSEHIRRYCAEHNLNAEIQTCSSGSSLIVSYEPPCDAVFLDIEMQNMDGMKAAELLPLTLTTGLSVKICLSPPMSKYKLFVSSVYRNLPSDISYGKLASLP